MPHATYPELKIPKTQISDIDKQYEKINSIIENLIKGMGGNCADTNIPEMFYGLMYLHTHYFTQEQITLAKYNFKDLCKIKAMHKEYLDGVIDLREKVAKHPKDFCHEMIEFMISWTESYFVSNQEAVEFLQSKGVK